MSAEKWVVKTDDGRKREVETKEEAKQAKKDLEDLGVEVNISPKESHEQVDLEGVEGTEDAINQSESSDETSSTPGIVQPVNIDEALEMYDEYGDLKSKLLNEGDKQDVDGGGTFIKKSGWRKIANAFNLDVEVVDYERRMEEGVVSFTVEARASAPNGKTVTAVSMAQSTEPNFTEIEQWENKVQKEKREELESDSDVVHVDGAFRRVKDPKEVNEHDLITLASTRAKNRAISDLVGGGEVSAEEVKK